MYEREAVCALRDISNENEWSSEPEEMISLRSLQDNLTSMHKQQRQINIKNQDLSNLKTLILARKTISNGFISSRNKDIENTPQISARNPIQTQHSGIRPKQLIDNQKQYTIVNPWILNPPSIKELHNQGQENQENQQIHQFHQHYVSKSKGRTNINQQESSRKRKTSTYSARQDQALSLKGEEDYNNQQKYHQLDHLKKDLIGEINQDQGINRLSQIVISSNDLNCSSLEQNYQISESSNILNNIGKNVFESDQHNQSFSSSTSQSSNQKIFSSFDNQTTPLFSKLNSTFFGRDDFGCQLNGKISSQYKRRNNILQPQQPLKINIDQLGNMSSTSRHMKFKELVENSPQFRLRLRSRINNRTNGIDLQQFSNGIHKNDFGRLLSVPNRRRSNLMSADNKQENNKVNTLESVMSSMILLSSRKERNTGQKIAGQSGSSSSPSKIGVVKYLNKDMRNNDKDWRDSSREREGDQTDVEGRRDQLLLDLPHRTHARQVKIEPLCLLGEKNFVTKDVIFKQPQQLQQTKSIQGQQQQPCSGQQQQTEQLECKLDYEIQANIQVKFSKKKKVKCSVLDLSDSSYRKLERGEQIALLSARLNQQHATHFSATLRQS